MFFAAPARYQIWPYQDAADDGGAGTGPAAGNPGNHPPTGGGRALSQTELDAIMGGVRAEARETAVRKLLEELGVADAAEAKQLITAGRDLPEKLTAAKAEAQAALERANERLMRSAVLLAARTAGFIDPEDCWTYIDRSKLSVDEQGQVQGIEQAVKEVAEAKKHLLASAQQTGSGGGTPRSSGHEPPAPSDAEMIAAK